MIFDTEEELARFLQVHIKLRMNILKNFSFPGWLLPCRSPGKPVRILWKYWALQLTLWKYHLPHWYYELEGQPG